MSATAGPHPALPEPVTPPFDIVRLSHVVTRVTDLERARAFYVDLLGLQVSAATEDRLYLRALEERNHHSLVLERAERAEIVAIGFKVRAASDLDAAAEHFEARGLPTARVTDEHLGECLRTRDPAGVPLEFYVGMTRLDPIHQDYGRYHGVRPLRIDHVNMFSADVDASVAFWHGLGFRTTEYTQDEDSGRLWAAWMQRKGNVHDVAFTNGRGPRLHHVAYWTPGPLAIIDLLDLMATTGWLANIERGPGRHGISNAFFLYVRDPDGHRVEVYSSDYQTCDPEHEPIRWDLKDPQRQTLWGAAAPRSWFEEGSAFAGAAINPPSLAATPIVAP